MSVYQVFDDDAQPLDATFTVEQFDGQPSVLLHSRHRNTRKDYLPALELLLQRLKSIEARINEVLVDTAYTRRHQLPRAVCRLPVRDRRYPIILSEEHDIRALRLALLSRIGATGLAPGAKSAHTPLKQIRLAVTLEADLTLGDLAAVLAGSRA